MPAGCRRRSPAARSTPPCASCRRPSARPCSPSTCFCRLVDDIADDGTRPRADARAAARRWRDDLDALYAGRPAGQAALPAGRRCRPSACRQADFLAVIDGMAMDVAADIRAPDLATLDLYCDRVAGAVGRLSIRIFGMEEGPGLRARAPAGPRPAAHQHPARSRRGCRDRPPLPAARVAGAGRNRHAPIRPQRSAIRASMAPAARWPRRRSTTSRRPTGCCAPGRAAACWRRG